jgi:hypothetical protein
VEAATITTGSSEYLRFARRAKWLSWASLGYMALEGGVAIGRTVVTLLLRTTNERPSSGI